MTQPEPFDPLTNRRVWLEVASRTIQPMFTLDDLAAEYHFDIRRAIAMLHTFVVSEGHMKH